MSNTSGVRDLIEVSRAILARLRIEKQERQKIGASPIFPNAACIEPLESAIAEAEAELGGQGIDWHHHDWRWGHES